MLFIALIAVMACWRENEQLQLDKHQLERENRNVWQALIAAGRCLELGQFQAAERALTNARTRARKEQR